MLLAAADPVGDAALLWRAAERLGIEPSALAAAEEAGLLEIGAQVRFRHPLVRSAAYRAASAGGTPRASTSRWRRRRDPELDPDRRAWHLARWRRPGPTRRWRPSSSAPPGGRRRAAASPQPRRSSSAPSR